MSPKSRRSLFLFLTFLFILVGTSLVLYSRGVRLDTKSLTLVRTGGIYLKSKPADTVIELDGRKVKNQAGLLQSGTLIDNLRPGVHRVSIGKEGYYDWKKEVAVSSTEVNAFDGIILWPNRGTERIAAEADNFYIQNNQLVLNNNNRLTFNEIPIVGSEVINFTPRGTLITYRKDNKTYYLSSISDHHSVLNLNTTFNHLKELQLQLPGATSITRIVSYPYNDQKLIVMANNSLYTLDAEKRTLELIASRINHFTVTGSEIIFEDGKGLSSFNLIFRSKSFISALEPKVIGRISEIGASPSGDIIVILEEDGELFLLEKSLGQLKLASENVTQFLFSDDGKKLALVLNNTVVKVYVKREDREKIITLNPIISGTKIEKLVWHKDDNYLFLKDSGGNLYFLEVDDSPPSNKIRIASGVKNFVYDKDNNLLYFNNSEGVWRQEI